MAPTGGFVSKRIFYLALGCLLLLHGHLLGVTAAEDDVSSFKPVLPTYTAFVGHVPVEFKRDISLIHTFLEVVSLGNQTVVFSLDIPIESLEGQMTLWCGTIDHAGDFMVIMKKKSTQETVAQSGIIKVSWPDFTVTLPKSHQALTGNVTTQISSSQVECESRQPQSHYFVQLLYFGENLTKDFSKPLNVVRSIEAQKIADINMKEIMFPCRDFDQAGSYKVVFKSGYLDANAVIAESDVLNVTWSKAYTLQSHSQNIMSCNKFIIVQYTKPRCSGDRDKIRLFKMVPHTESSIASPTDLVYVTERRAKSSKESVSFKCELFHESVVKYCFKYISTANNGAVDEQAMMCLPTRDAADQVINGGWSEWSEWSSCSVSCGTGQQTRFRTCDNPSPSNGGDYCKGPLSQSSSCNNTCQAYTSAPPKDYTPAPNCFCGCHMTAPEGKIVTSLSCHGSTLWTIQVDPGLVIELTFETFTLDSANPDTWVKVRDGNSHMADLLFDNSGTYGPQIVKTSGNALFIEFMAPEKPGMNGYEMKNERFVAIYASQSGNGTGVVASGEDDGEVPWANTVTLIGIALCVLVVLATIAFVCHHRVASKRRRRKQLAANQALLTNGDVPNSPSHSGQSIQGSTNVSFHDPLSSSPTKREYIMAKSAVVGVGVSTESPTHQPSLAHKGPQSKPPHGGRELSQHKSQKLESQHSKQPQLSSKHVPVSPQRSGSVTPGSAQSIPSPYAANANSDDYKHDPKLFDSSVVRDSGGKGHRHRGRQKHDTNGGRRRSGSSPSPPVSPQRYSSQQPSSKPRDKSHAPMADLEDLSPTTPTTPTHGRSLASPSRTPRAHRQERKMVPITENIQMDSLYDKQGKKKTKGTADTAVDIAVPGQRPPVEGRDSLTRKKGKTDTTRVGTPVTGRTPTTPDLQNANYVPVSQNKGRPEIKPLPLRSVQRPDGQSPEAHPQDPNANTPSSYMSSEMSPILQKSKLFPDTQSMTPSDIVAPMDDYEYDDYVPNLPGSYFTMDPTAYTLTWSQQPPWAQKNLGSRATSQASVDPDRRSRGSLC